MVLSMLSTGSGTKRILSWSCLVVAVIAIHNALVGVGLGELPTVVVNLVLVGVVVAAGRRRGLRAHELGFQVTGRGLAIAGGATVVAAAVVAVANAVGALSNATVGELTRGQAWFRLLVGIPIGTAVCEEVIFRGAFLAGFDRCTTRRRSVLITSAAFGLWHVAAEAARTGSLGIAVLPGVVATAAASALVLCPLRRWSGDLLAPIAVHAVVNAGVFAVVAMETGVLG
jgi:membrane protease YdiL (CAAX protease family)